MTHRCKEHKPEEWDILLLNIGVLLKFILALEGRPWDDDDDDDEVRLGSAQLTPGFCKHNQFLYLFPH